MAFDKLNSMTEVIGSSVKKIRSNISEARSSIENRANTLIYSISELLEKIENIVRRLKCIADAKNLKEPIATVCTTWRLVVSGDVVSLIRIKPATTISFNGTNIVFHKDHVGLKARSTLIKLCKNSYCKEIDVIDRSAIIKSLYQITYLAREVGYHVSKTLEAVNTCVKREAPDCLRT